MQLNWPARLKAKSLHIFSDFDGTITDNDTLVFLSTHLGAGPAMVQTIGRALKTNEMTLRAAIAAEMGSLRCAFAEAEKLLRAHVQLDPHFHEFAAWCQSATIPLTVLSAGFQQTIELFLPPDQFPHLTVLANQLEPDAEQGWQCRFRDDSDDGHDKAAPLLEARAHGKYTIFIGDGFSDRRAAEHADEVFAKHSLADYCHERAIPFHPYQTFAEVWQALLHRTEI